MCDGSLIQCGNIAPPIFELKKDRGKKESKCWKVITLPLRDYHLLILSSCYIIIFFSHFFEKKRDPVRVFCKVMMASCELWWNLKFLAFHIRTSVAKMKSIKSMN